MIVFVRQRRPNSPHTYPRHDFRLTTQSGHTPDMPLDLLFELKRSSNIPRGKIRDVIPRWITRLWHMSGISHLVYRVVHYVFWVDKIIEPRIINMFHSVIMLVHWFPHHQYFSLSSLRSLYFNIVCSIILINRQSDTDTDTACTLYNIQYKYMRFG